MTYQSSSMVNMSANFDEDTHSGLVNSIVFTRFKFDVRMHTLTKPHKRYYIHATMRCIGIKIAVIEELISLVSSWCRDI